MINIETKFTKREIGSDFHWVGPIPGPTLNWPTPHEWFCTGRGVMTSLWRHLLLEHSNMVLWAPDYFCPEVVKAWREQGIRIARYEDRSGLSQPNWKSLRPLPGDAVLAMNYFGVSQRASWDDWHKDHSSVVLIEDHTHDPVSPWALTSTADYAFASIRKILPVPDGALLWSGKGRPLAGCMKSRTWMGSTFKLAAMSFKSSFLTTANPDIRKKEIFRGFQETGERLLSQEGEHEISPWSREFLNFGFPVSWRRAREDNTMAFLKLLPNDKPFDSLFRTWPPGQVPFNPVLVFDDTGTRDACRYYLSKRKVYCPVHWTVGRGASEASRRLSERILTIPLDPRYNVSDAANVAGMLNEFTING